MKPFLYQILLLLTLACLVPVLCDGESVSSIIKNGSEIIDGSQAAADKVILTVKDLANESRITLGAVLIVVGLLFLVIGKFLIRIIFALGGGCLLGGLAYYIGNVIEEHRPPSTGLIVGVAVVTVIGVMLGYFLLKVGTVLLGALAGVSLTMLIARMKYVSDSTIWIVGVCLVLGFCLLAFFLSNIIIVALTSIIGSFAFMIGVDCFIEKGFSDFVVGFDLNQLESPSTDVTIMFGATLFIAVLGFLFQLCIQRKK